MSEPALWNKPSQKDKHCMIPLTRGVTASLNFAPYCQNMFQNAYTNYLLESKEIKPVNSKGNQSWILIRRTDAESFQYFGHLMWRSDSLERILMQGKIEGMRKRDRGGDGCMDHQHDGHEFEHDLGVGDGQGSLACCSRWVCKESDTTEQLNWTDTSYHFTSCAWEFQCVNAWETGSFLFFLFKLKGM